VKLQKGLCIGGLPSLSPPLLLAPSLAADPVEGDGCSAPPATARLQAALFVGQADMVLVGADALTADAAVNKAGTHLVALAARAAGVPVLCVADSGKVSPGPLAALACPARRGNETEGEEKGAEEIVAAWGRSAPEG
jgi:hypothetical protein